MLDFPPWKTWGIFLTVLVGLVFAVPNFFPEEVVAKWPAFVPREQITSGPTFAAAGPTCWKPTPAASPNHGLRWTRRGAGPDWRRGRGGATTTGEEWPTGGGGGFRQKDRTTDGTPLIICKS